MEFPVILLILPSASFWWCSQQPDNPVDSKSTVSLMANVIFPSTEPIKATFAILDPSIVTEALTVSTSVSKRTG
jgi:hypothetical protein